MKKLKGLKHFQYFDVRSDFQLNLEDDENYFNRILQAKNIWNGKNIKERFGGLDALGKPISNPPFDSGIVCATQMPSSEANEITSLKCFVAPYRLLSATITRLAEVRKIAGNNHKIRHRKKYLDENLKVPKVPPSEIAVAIGMVLSIIATKGSVEKGNRLPYLLLTQRTNVKLRNNELDAPVVEGMNCRDISNTGFADLDSIAMRALAEERGINCKMLEEKELLHLPKCYYLGYDAEYHQWNFFGTVVIDCTVEEIIREGCFFTKDKFESKNILAIPLNRKVLSYHLSQSEIKTIPVKMWNSAHASIQFAMNDYEERTARITEQKSKDFFPKWKKIVQFCKKMISKSSLLINKTSQVLNAFFFSLSFVLLLISCVWLAIAQPLVNASDHWSKIITMLSSLIAFGTCLIVVAMQRAAIVSEDNLLFIKNHFGSNDISEISVFRGVTLIDGNIDEKERQVIFSVQQGNSHSQLSVLRKCNVFMVDKKESTWTLKDRTNIDEMIEHMNWQICPGTKEKEYFRVIIPYINNGMQIILQKNTEGKLEHPIDIAISYKEFREKEKWHEKEIESLICQKIHKRMNDLSEGKSTPQGDFNFRFLLYENNTENDKGQYIIVGFADKVDAMQWSSEDFSEKLIRPLSYELTSTTYAQRFKDNVTRVACEYAIAIYVGYQMSVR